MLSGRHAVGRRHVGERQQLVDAAHGVAGDDLGQHIAQISLRIDGVHLASLCRPPNYAEWARFPQDSR